MASKHKVLSEQMRRLSQLIQAATQSEDWPALKRYDLQLRELLVTHKTSLHDSRIAAEMQQLKKTHAIAAHALAQATHKLKQQMELVSAQQERAEAYQSAMTMELTK